MSESNIERIVSSVKELRLDEPRWNSANWAATPQDLWECLVALFLHEQGCQPHRFSSRSVNLDFGFTVDGNSMYAECVCTSDDSCGDRVLSEGRGLDDGSGVETGVSYIQNNLGLRLTSSIKHKHDHQIVPFHEHNGLQPTSLFLNSGLLSDMPSLARVDGVVMPLGTCVPALYGLDGVTNNNLLDGSIFMRQQCDSHKGNNTPVSRIGFRNGDYKNLSAVIHSNKSPVTLVDWLYLDYQGSVSQLFSEHAEIIINASACDQVVLDRADIFPDLLAVYIHKDGVVLCKGESQQLVKVVC